MRQNKQKHSGQDVNEISIKIRCSFEKEEPE